MTRPVAILTGLGRRSGIAFGIATRLVADGWDLAVSHWSPHDARYGRDDETPGMVAELQEGGARVVATELDFADADAVVAFARTAADEIGAASALVLCHAEGVDSDVFTTTVESFDRHHAVNARAAWLLIREFALRRPERRADGGVLDNGAIVALTSDHVTHNLPYGASKGSLDRIVQGAAGELGVRGIRANIVNPGPVDTGWMDDAIRASGVARQPTGRLGTPADVAQTVAWLVSPESAWVTGQLIKADGGFSS